MEVSPHPPYSPDLPLYDFQQFWYQEGRLRGRNFRSVEEVNVAVRDWLHNRQSLFFCRGIYVLV